MMTRHESMTCGGLDGYHNFTGDDFDIREFFCGPGRHRDSDCLQESNFHSALKLLGGESSEVQVHRFGHWVVGWLEQIFVSPTASDEVAILKDINASLEDYPVLDDDDFSQREMDSANQVWEDCYSPEERISYIRKHRGQFEFNDYHDLISCVRGKYFAGYASELLS